MVAPQPSPHLETFIDRRVPSEAVPAPPELPEAWAAPAKPATAAPRPDAFTIELPQSKALARLRYEEADKALIVEFRSGKVYRYFGISRDDYTKLATSASPGARFNEAIQPYHEYEQLEDIAPSKVRPEPKAEPSTHL